MSEIKAPELYLNTIQIVGLISRYFEENKRRLGYNSFDVDPKTIRVHEGQRGGFEGISVTLKPKT